MAKLDEDIKKLFNQVRVKIGGSVRSTPLTDDDLCTLLETCVDDYAAITQNWMIENQWSTLYNKDITETDLAFAMSTRTFDYNKDYAYWFSREVGLQQRGPWELKKDFITIEAGKQSYVIPAGREVNRVLWLTPQTTTAAAAGMFGGMGGGIGDLGAGGMGLAQFGGGMGNTTYGGGYLYQAVDTVLLAMDLKQKQSILKSDLMYKITGGPKGTKILQLLSTPGSNITFGQYGIADKPGFGMVGRQVWYFYYDVKSKKDAEKCRILNPDIILLPDQVPLNKLSYNLLNPPTQTIIRQLLVAEAKQTTALIFGRFSGKMGIQEAEANIDYAILLEQAKEERDKAISELRERLTRMSPLAISENNKTIATNLLELSKTKPVVGWYIC